MGRKQLKLSKRQKTAAAKRAAIMSTAEFQLWWDSRRHIHPIPTDPYRAFMIDRGIPARPLHKPLWQPRTNRSDYPHSPRVDTYVPQDGVPRKQKNRRRYPKHQYRPNYVPVSARKIGKLTPEEEELKRFTEKMAEHYHTSVPDIIFERDASSLTSSMSHGDLYNIPPFMRIGVKGLNKGTLPNLKAVVAHEMGHHVHKRGGETMLNALGVKVHLSSTRIEKERTAWKIADPFMTDKRPTQKWLKKYALGTYLGTVHKRS